MGQDAEVIDVNGPSLLREFGLDPSAMERISRFVSMVEQAPLNLTAWRGETLWRRGVRESLALGALLPALPGKALDIGSGGGFPGMIVAVAHPTWQWTLLEARERRARFLEKAANTLDLNNVEVVHARAETWVSEVADRREAFDVVTLRAVAPPAASLELGLPFMAIGGSLLLVQGHTGPRDLDDAASLLSRLGGQLSRWVCVDDNAMVAVVTKSVPTPALYPRTPKKLGR